jgi:hypothetical protein
MNFNENLDVQNLTTDEIREVLEDLGVTLSAEQLDSMVRFAREVGGFENALTAIDALAEVRDAA